MPQTIYKAREILEGRYNKKEEVTLRGWISQKDKTKRTMTIRDGTGYIGVSFNKNLYTELPEIGIESFVEIRGTVNYTDETPSINVIYHEVLKPSVDYPSPEEISRPAYRHLKIRDPKMRAKIIIWNTTEDTIRRYMKEKGFTKVPTPSITKMAAENPATLFYLRYFDYSAHLAQTGKPYLDSAIPQFENVWDFVRTFRQEKVRSRKHLSEFRTVEILKAHSNLNDMMRLTEDLFIETIRTVADVNSKELETLGRDISVLTRDISVSTPGQPLLREFTYDEAREALKRAYKKRPGKEIEVEWGRSFTPDEEDMLCDGVGSAFFIKDYPVKIRSFYIDNYSQRPDISKSFDLIAPISGEIATGGELITEYQKLKQRIIEHGYLRPFYNWFLNLRKHGEVETSFVGLGFERLVVHITGEENITHVVPFPRTFAEDPIP